MLAFFGDCDILFSVMRDRIELEEVFENEELFARELVTASRPKMVKVKGPWPERSPNGQRDQSGRVDELHAIKQASTRRMVPSGKMVIKLLLRVDFHQEIRYTFCSYEGQDKQNRNRNQKAGAQHHCERPDVEHRPNPKPQIESGKV